MFDKFDWKKLLVEIARLVLAALIANFAGEYAGRQAGKVEAQAVLAAKK